MTKKPPKNSSTPQHGDPATLEKDVNALITLYNQGDYPILLKKGALLAARYPNIFIIHNILGVTNSQCGHLQVAVENFTKALSIEPNHAAAHSNLSYAQYALGQFKKAVASAEHAVALKPDFASAYNNLANALKDLGRLDEAVANYAKTIALDPSHAAARAQKLHLEAHLCTWDTLPEDRAFVAELGVSGPEVPPFTMLALEDNPARHHARAILSTKQKYSRPPLPAIARPTEKPNRLRVGYFSADFHDHATMFLMEKMFALHDQTRFEIHAFSYGQKTDAMQTRLANSVEKFHDVRHLSDKDIALLARQHHIDIAVDLKGYTNEGRPSIFAYRAAPLQVNYLGYPGTLGAAYIDYIIADKILIPDASQSFYTEKPIYLPGSYQVNDNSRTITAKTPSRAALGLPEKGFVFACFNSNYKISPCEFDIWMQLLSQVEGSVLWLLKSNIWATKNLKKEAKKRGVDPARLVFAGKASHGAHLARHRAADLFLDTFIVNAHTTASDALWAGLPLVTKIGDGFAARVAASLLTAMDLPELVTRSEQDYAQLALALATNPAKLQAIKEKLTANRDTQPLFDTARFTKNIERGYQQIYDRYFRGLPPQPIWVEENDR